MWSLDLLREGPARVGQGWGCFRLSSMLFEKLAASFLDRVWPCEAHEYLREGVKLKTLEVLAQEMPLLERGENLEQDPSELLPSHYGFKAQGMR